MAAVLSLGKLPLGSSPFCLEAELSARVLGELDEAPPPERSGTRPDISPVLLTWSSGTRQETSKGFEGAGTLLVLPDLLGPLTCP